jgi:hypothetical protein
MVLSSGVYTFEGVPWREFEFVLRRPVVFAGEE